MMVQPPDSAVIMNRYVSMNMETKPELLSEIIYFPKSATTIEDSRRL